MRRIHRVAVALALGTGMTTTPARAQTRGDYVALESRPAFPALATCVTLALRDVPLGDAVTAIAREAGLSIAYDRALPGLERRRTLALDSVPAAAALLRALDGAPLQAMVSPQGTLVLVARRRPATGASSPTAHAVGRVSEAGTGAPIADARVELVGTRHETHTREDGGFSLGEVPGGAQTVRVARLGYRPELVDVAALGADSLLVALERAAVPLASVVVTPGTFGLLQPGLATPHTMTREQIDATPQIGEDIYRVATRLPGIAASDFSASFYARGAPAEELYATLDGLELIEPFHLRDIGGALSIVDAQAIGGVALTMGGTSAEVGDRLAGAFALRTMDPSHDAPKHTVGLSLMNVRAMSRGGFAGGRGGWLVSARRGYIDLALKASGADDSLSPRYDDVFAKLTWDAGRAGRFAAHVLHASDALHYDDGPNEPTIRSHYGSDYAWGTWAADVGGRVRQETVASLSHLTWRRDGLLAARPAPLILVADRRALTSTKLRTDWSLGAGPRALLRWGGDVTTGTADYDYVRAQERTTVRDGQLAQRRDSVRVLSAVDGTRVGAYVSQRVRPLASLTLEGGARWDRSSQSGGGRLDPRLNVAWTPRAGTSVRGAWGRTSQAQPLQSLAVQDGVSRFAPLEHAEQRALGVDQLLPGAIALRVEAYERRYLSQRARWVNTSGSIAMFPEVRWDRLRLDPGHGRSRGIELLLSRDGGRRTDWSMGYALASVADSIDGRLVPRDVDQRHALQGMWSVHPESNRWRLTVAGTWHSGWPYTPPDARADSARAPDGSLVWVADFGPGTPYTARLDAYQRVDVRWLRWFETRRGRISLFAELFNVFGAWNERGRYTNIAPQGQSVAYVNGTERSIPRLPTVGVTWELGGGRP